MGHFRAVELKRGAHKPLCRDLDVAQIASFRGADLTAPLAYLIAEIDLSRLPESCHQAHWWTGVESIAPGRWPNI